MRESAPSDSRKLEGRGLINQLRGQKPGLKAGFRLGDALVSRAMIASLFGSDTRLKLCYTPMTAAMLQHASHKARSASKVHRSAVPIPETRQ